MRGKADVVLNRIDRIGITPAYAGKSGRICKASTMTEGSPPPMRGKVNKLPGINIPSGITPAYAGKSPEILQSPLAFRDHPRLCGEKFQTFFCKVYVPGSPPPMRGKDDLLPQNRINHRITPAYAGKRYLSHIGDALMGDHPRLCGEKKFSVNSAFRCVGSPPPMRGKVE